MHHAPLNLFDINLNFPPIVTSAHFKSGGQRHEATVDSGRYSETPNENKNELPYTFRSKKSNLQAVKAKIERDSEILDDDAYDFTNMGPGAGLLQTD